MAIRCSPARSRPTSRISPAPSGYSPPVARSTRNSRHTMRTPSPPSSNWPPAALMERQAGLGDAVRPPAKAGPIVGGVDLVGTEEPVFDPSDRRRRIGTVTAADADMIEEALARAARAAPSWSNTPAETRAAL